MLTPEQISIKRRVKIVASDDKPSFSKPKLIKRKKTNKNNIGREKINNIKIKQPTGKKNIKFSRGTFYIFSHCRRGRGRYDQLWIWQVD